MRTILVLPDPHFGNSLTGPNGGHDEPAWSCALQAIGIVQPDEVLLLGDLGEWESCSPWMYKKRKRPPLQYVLDALDKDYAEVNKQLDRLDHTIDLLKKAPRKTLLEGNHELWVNDMIEEVGVVAKEYAIKKKLRLSQRGWTYHPYGKYIKRGKLHIYHGGHFSNKYHAAEHATKVGNVVYGHTHDMQTATVPTLDGSRGAWSIGCLCAMNKKFMKGLPANWSHGFAIVHLHKDGRFLVDPVRIEKGWCVVQGREVEGK